MKSLIYSLILVLLCIGISSFCDTEKKPGEENLDEKTSIRIQLMEQEVNFLRRENEKLKKELKQYQLQDMVLRFQKDVSRIRGLGVRQPLQTKFLNKEEVRNYVLREIDRQYPGENLKHYENILIRLAFIPQGTDIKEVILSLYTEQAAGFYDDITKWFYVVEEFDLNQTITGIILSHEICHVLQDQNFHIDTTNLYERNNDDEIYAILGVLEGDATILMSEWLKENFEFTSVFQMLSALGLDQSAYNETPYFLQQLLIFPYLQGSIFMMDILTLEGMQSRDNVFRKLPRSTEQILHPEKYHTIIDEPTSITLPDIGKQLGRGWEKKFENTFGEIGFKLLFEQYTTPEEASASSSGWDGDRYILYENDAGRFTILWDSVWDSDNDAIEASKALIKAMEKRYPAGKGSGWNDKEWSYKLPQEEKKDISRIILKRKGIHIRFGITSESKHAALILELEK